MITEKNNFRRGEREYKGNDRNVRKNLRDLFGRRNAVSMDAQGLASICGWFHLCLWPNRSSAVAKKTKNKTEHLRQDRHDGTYSYFSNTRVLPKEKWITWWFKSLIRDMHATLTFFLLYHRWPTKTECFHDRTITQQLNKISKISYFSSNHIQQLSYIINIC